MEVSAVAGQHHLIKLKHGTGVADGAWTEVKSAYPSQAKRGYHERLADYVNAWAWKARRHGHDMCQVLAAHL